MTNETFINEIRAINAENVLLHERIKHLEANEKNIEIAYISNNANYFPGDKVKMVSDGKEYICFISRINVDSKGAFSYNFIKSKKDGTLSSRLLYVNSWDCEIIELIDTAERTDFWKETLQNKPVTV